MNNTNTHKNMTGQLFKKWQKEGNGV